MAHLGCGLALMLALQAKLLVLVLPVDPSAAGLPRGTDKVGHLAERTVVLGVEGRRERDPPAVLGTAVKLVRRVTDLPWHLAGLQPSSGRAVRDSGGARD